MNTNGKMRTGRVLVAAALAAAAFGLGQEASAQFHGVQIGKACQPDRCVGDTVDCTIEVGYSDDFGDTLELQEAFDVVDPKGLDCNQDADADPGCRVPAVGNLPIVQVSGNTTCTVGGSLPCLICDGGAACGANPVPDNEPGVVVFQSNTYIVQPGDPDPLPDRANVRVRDLCDGCGTPPCPGCSMVPNLVQFTAASTLLPCEDNNVCTENICVSGTFTTPGTCTFEPDCNVPAIDCPTGNACLVPICDAFGCCDDTPLCPPGEVCCANGTPCNDLDACTVDFCGTSGCCDTTPLCPPGVDCCADGSPCNDGDPCTADFCGASGCCDSTPICVGEVCCADGTPCNDLNVCTVDSCGPDGCCDTTPLCPPGEVCCANGTPCNDLDACTVDSCAPPGCCDTTPLCPPGVDCCADGSPCNDLDACTVDTCNAPGCCGTTPLCPPGVDCCADGTPCNDLDACTVDTCNAPGCCGTTPLCPPGADCCADGSPCNDGDACTVDFCGPGGCCDDTPLCPPGVDCCADGSLCNDGDACTVDFCGPGGCCDDTPLCPPGSDCCADGSPCDDGNVCTVDFCGPAGCCQSTPQCVTDLDCEDGNLCTNDVCSAGCCTFPPVICPDDPDPCVFGFCDPSTGLCASSGTSCDDGNPCTIDSCDPTGRCVYEPSPCCGVECPPTFKAKFDIWNDNERRFSGTERCIDSWDQTMLSDYTVAGQRNHFLRQLLQTDHGKARIDGMASTVCDAPGENNSVNAPLLGLSVRELVFQNGQRALASSELVGMGFEPGYIAYDLGNSPPGTAIDSRDTTRDGALTTKSDRAVSTAPVAIGDSVVAGGHVPPPAEPMFFRSAVSQKGSLLAFVKVEVKWNAAGTPIQDTIIELTNDYFEPVWVQAYLVHGDACVWVDNAFPLTPDQPTYWSALTGGPMNLSPISVFGDACPDDDPTNPGGTRARGYLLVWAVDQITNAEISWNHLSGAATIINYAATAAWEYGPWAFQAVAEVPHGSPLLAPHGVLQLDGTEYQMPPDQLLLDFFASGASFTNGVTTFGVDTDLTLWAVLKDLRQDPGPFLTLPPP